MSIIQSRLDIDKYKLTMGQYVWKHRRGTPVTYGFTCRTENANLGWHIDIGRLREEIAEARLLRLTQRELLYLKIQHVDGQPLYDADFLEFFNYLNLPTVEIVQENENLDITVSGTWEEAIYWETYILSIVKELYLDEILKQMGISMRSWLQSALTRLSEKIERLKGRHGIKIMEFGTRRRRSGFLQDLILQAMLDEVPGNVLGTSNIYLAMKHGITDYGTFAHELDMGECGVIWEEGGGDEELLTVHDRVMDLWEETYPTSMLIDLPDTFGSQWALDRMTEERANNWIGARGDSGDPYTFGRQLIRMYNRFGIDPKEKLLFPSDGLQIEEIIGLYEHFVDEIQIAFGWGTDLTSDIGQCPISIVMKLISVFGATPFKFSDTPGKIMGGSIDQLNRLKVLFQYPEPAERAIVY